MEEVTNRLLPLLKQKNINFNLKGVFYGLRINNFDQHLHGWHAFHWLLRLQKNFQFK
jgi:hypothetical protein